MAQSAAVNYSIDEFQQSTPDGLGGQLPTTRDRRGGVSHVEGHPDWHPIILTRAPGPFTLVLNDGRKLKVIMKNLQGSVQCSGDFF